jgi:hypothetical protein
LSKAQAAKPQFFRSEKKGNRTNERNVDENKDSKAGPKDDPFGGLKPRDAAAFEKTKVYHEPEPEPTPAPAPVKYEEKPVEPLPKQEDIQYSKQAYKASVNQPEEYAGEEEGGYQQDYYQPRRYRSRGERRGRGGYRGGYRGGRGGNYYQGGGYYQDKYSAEYEEDYPKEKYHGEDEEKEKPYSVKYVPRTDKKGINFKANCLEEKTKVSAE